MQETDTYSPPGVALPSFAQDRAHGMMALRVSALSYYSPASYQP
jgi:hypothetical protein